jgi:hypothetical protein
MFAAFSVIDRKFCCTLKTQVPAADGSLHIETARSKRKCNRPLSHCNGLFIHFSQKKIKN